MSRKLKIALITGAIILTCGIYTWGIPAALNTNANRDFAQKRIYETTGYRIDLGNAKISMGWFPSIWIKSDNISIFNDDQTKALSIDNPKLKLKLLPLIRKRVEISHLSADREDICLVYSKDSQFMLGQYPIKLPENESEFSLSKLNLNLGNYNIFLDDKKNNKKLSLIGEYINHGKYIQNKHLELGTKGVFNTDGKSTDIFADIDISLPIDRIAENKYRIDAEIKDFDLSSISNYANTLTNGYLRSLDGTVNVFAKTKTGDFGHKNTVIDIKTKDLKIMGQELATSIIANDTLQTTLDFGTVENGILINKFILKAPRINASAKGKLYNLGHKAPTYDITASLKDSRAEDIIQLLPGSETLLPDFNLYKLKKYMFYGDGNAKLRFKGQGTFPHVYGFVKVRDGILIKPLRGAPGNADIDLKFKGQEMFVDVYVPATGVDQHVEVKGKALIDGTKYSELNIKSTEAVQLAPAREVLVPLHEILKFQLGPVPMMTATGVGNIDMRSAGRKVDPHIWGRINFSNATATLIDVHNLQIDNGAGEVVFDDTMVTFKTHQAYLDGKPIDIHGDCKMLGKLNVYVSSKGQDIKKLIHCIETSPILADIQKVVKPFTRPNGIADVLLHIYGNVTDAEEIVFNKDLFAKGTVTL
ncbi:AsmA family protein, partial [bacterium]|nr:AsmA family protein [bacterium]